MRWAPRIIVTLVALVGVAALSLLAAMINSVGHVSVSVGVSVPAVDTPVTLVSSADGTSERSHRLPTTVYGHVHIARTGGSFVNRMLSQKYQRVCGNKGYSLPELTHKVDEVKQAQRRARKRNHKNAMIPKTKSKGLGQVMEEIGFQDCDYMSHETGWEFWQMLRGKVKVGSPIELHVPCRDPVDHLMSLCNFYDHSLRCEDGEEEFMSGVRKCLHRGVEARFSNQLLKSPPLTVKCMDFKKQFTDYMDYMGARLEKKTEEEHQIVIKKNSHGRENRTECIWQHPDLMEKTRNFMTTNFDYFRFCNRCLGFSYNRYLLCPRRCVSETRFPNLASRNMDTLSSRSCAFWKTRSETYINARKQRHSGLWVTYPFSEN